MLLIFLNLICEHRKFPQCWLCWFRLMSVFSSAPVVSSSLSLSCLKVQSERVREKLTAHISELCRHRHREESSLEEGERLSRSASWSRFVCNLGTLPASWLIQTKKWPNWNMTVQRRNSLLLFTAHFYHQLTRTNKCFPLGACAAPHHFPELCAVLQDEPQTDKSTWTTEMVSCQKPVGAWFLSASAAETWRETTVSILPLNVGSRAATISQRISLSRQLSNFIGAELDSGLVLLLLSSYGEIKYQVVSSLL